jgi:hypothetical protein
MGLEEAGSDDRHTKHKNSLLALTAMILMLLAENCHSCSAEGIYSEEGGYIRLLCLLVQVHLGFVWCHTATFTSRWIVRRVSLRLPTFYDEHSHFLVYDWYLPGVKCQSFYRQKYNSFSLTFFMRICKRLICLQRIGLESARFVYWL